MLKTRTLGGPVDYKAPTAEQQAEMRDEAQREAAWRKECNRRRDARLIAECEASDAAPRRPAHQSAEFWMQSDV